MIDKDMLEAIGQLMDARLAPMQEDIRTLKDDVQSLKTDSSRMTGDIQSLKADSSRMAGDIQSLKADSSRMAGDIQSLKTDSSRMAGDIQSLKADNVRLIDLEKKVGLILEGQAGMNEKFAKLDTVAEDVEEIKLTVRAMEAVTQRNSNDIQKLRAVK